MTPLLEVRGLHAGYGGTEVLFGVDLVVGEGEVVALGGRNGMGKSTTIAAIMGLLQPSAGEVLVDGRDLTGAAPFRLSQAGLGLVPEGRRIFPTLTVEENLLATASVRNGADWTLARVLDFFPPLAARKSHRGGQLSGGEQQMLAIGRALMTNPRLLILDEATEGLAPLVRAQIWACLAALKQEGHAILVVDKVVDALLRLADRHVILERGRVAWAGTSAEFAADRSIREAFLAV
jgi:branched-chain amino acid transport system ATP-binding protein